MNQTFMEWMMTVAPLAEFTRDAVIVDGLCVRIIDVSKDEDLLWLSRGGDQTLRNVLFFSDEWESRREQVKGVILAKLGIFERKTGARKCECRQIGKGEAKDFLEQYHLQGANNLAMVYLGLFMAEELLAVMSLGRHNRQIAENRIVLDRLCFKSGVKVVGGSARLFAAAVEWAKLMKYDEIVSFSDNRWTTGGVYPALGFQLEKSYRPDYFYINNGERLSKQSQKKDDSGCPENMTEFEWARHRGLVRAYDLGKKRWIYPLNKDKETWREQLSRRCAEQHHLGQFKHSHIRGYFKSAKNGEEVYYGSSYELRCMYLLEEDPQVASFRRADAFKGEDRWRNPDLFVEFVNGNREIWEIKSSDRLQEEDVVYQISESLVYASSIGAGFRVWTEASSGMKDAHQIGEWARRYIAESTGNTVYLERARESNRKRHKRHYDRHIANDKVTVHCELCGIEHTPLRKSYESNIARNGVYVCEKMGGQIAGKRPKLSLRKTNPHAVEGKKECFKCKGVFAIEGNFNIRRASYDGYDHLCKICRSEENKHRYQQKKPLVANAWVGDVPHSYSEAEFDLKLEPNTAEVSSEDVSPIVLKPAAVVLPTEKTAEELRKEINRAKSKRYRERHPREQMEVWCDKCQQNHTLLKETYDKSMAKYGRFLCKSERCSLSGQKPKTALRKVNPYAAEGKKQCAGPCGLVLPVDNFDIRNASSDGRHRLCKQCRSSARKIQIGMR